MRTIEELIDDLQDAAQADAARQSLIQAGREAVMPLLARLSQAEPKQCWQIINILAKLRDPRAVPAVSEFLLAENGALRVAAAQCLGEIGHRSAIVPLLRALEPNRCYGALVWIVQALGRLGDSRATEPLLALMQETDSAAVRYTTIEALGLIGDLRAVEPIEQCLDDDSHHVRDRAQTALARLRTALA
ncbi:MAG: HEAT repeat domain-containing protein [Chloroflexi bacterium]|jgi:HEAT repeat protein|nr:HEAT repeat domain-containing protein [Chloroflexota bacterium]